MKKRRRIVWLAALILLALAGASMLALDGENWRKLAEIPEKCRYLELSGRDDFSRVFTDSLTF